MHPQYTPTFTARFWAKVNQNGPVPSHRSELGPCWIWTAGTKAGGYGIENPDSGTRLAHRISYILTYGTVPDGICVLHACDNPPCVRPSHLFVGTHKDNAQDCRSKGRAVWQKHPGILPAGDLHWARRMPERISRGESRPAAKLTDADVVAIRMAYATGGISTVKLAAQYEVKQPTIWKIVKRLAWTHVA